MEFEDERVTNNAIRRKNSFTSMKQKVKTEEEDFKKWVMVKPNNGKTKNISDINFFEMLTVLIA